MERYMPDGRRKLTDDELRVHVWRRAVDIYRSKRTPLTARFVYEDMQQANMTAGVARIQKALDTLVADGKMMQLDKYKFRPRLRSDS
jgi:Fe2+ or Zn2+ uptake regulation protein